MSYSRKELCECAWRDLQKRKAILPKAVRERKVTQREAEDMIAKMEAIYRILSKMPDDFIAFQ
jgi:hypothetical protein